MAKSRENNRPAPLPYKGEPIDQKVIVYFTDTVLARLDRYIETQSSPRGTVIRDWVEERLNAIGAA